MMKALLTALALLLASPAAAQVRTVTDEMVACRDRDAIYGLVRIISLSGPDAFMSEARRRAAAGECRFVAAGTQVTVHDRHWRGTVCVSEGSGQCLWIVENVVR